MTNNEFPQLDDAKRKPIRSEKRRVRFSQLPEPIQQMARDNLEFHRDFESVSRRFGVHQSDLYNDAFWRLAEQVRANSGPKGPSNVIAFRRAA